MAGQPITHELKLGTLKLTFANTTKYSTTQDENDVSHLSMSATFELASSGELYGSTYDDSGIRQLCPVFAQLPELAADALKVEPNVTVTDALVVATFETHVFTRKYEINL